jgi:hypothetical protein
MLAPAQESWAEDESFVGADCAARSSRAKGAGLTREATFCSAPCPGMLCFAACIAEYLPASQISILHHAANLELPPTIFDEPLHISRLEPFTSVQKPPQTFHKWRPGFDVAERYGGQTKHSDRECCQMTLGPPPNPLSAQVLSYPMAGHVDDMHVILHLRCLARLL